MSNIVVIGELGIDKFIYGKIDRLSPEAPVPVLLPIEVTENPGMAGNVVKNLEAISDSNTVTHYHQTEKITKTRMVEKKTNHMFLRMDEGELTKCTPYKHSNDLSKFDAVVISDYDKGYLTQDDIIEIGKSAKISILDSKKKLNTEVVHHIDFIKLNESEAELNKELVALFPKRFLVTLGSNGVKYDGVLYPSPNPQETIDVSGAGDTFVASFIHKYLESKNIERSIGFANEMSSIVVSMRGVNTPI
tara:strand:+ start:1717 stop:2457 length:741 start_codon:yes stop_codon:yes gene_type:complete